MDNHRSENKFADNSNLKTESLDEYAQAPANLVEIKQDPNIKLEPEDGVDTIEYTPRPVQLNEIFTPKVEKVEPDDDEDGNGRKCKIKTKAIDNSCSSEMGNHSNQRCKVKKQQEKDTRKSPIAGPSRTAKKSAHKKLHKCAECRYVTPWSSHIIAHMRKHTGEQPFPCARCAKRFTSKQSLKSHLKVHVTKDSLNCSICWRIFATENELLDHESTCKQCRYECHLCKKFTTLLIPNLKRHMRVHNGERPFKCDKCAMKFTRKDYLEKHLKNHDNPRLLKFRCSVCALNFVNQYKKDAHELNCKRRRYECYLCQSYETHLKHRLQVHMRRYHTGERPFKCNLCDTCYADGSGLNNHKKSNHKQ